MPAKLTYLALSALFFLWASHIISHTSRMRAFSSLSCGDRSEKNQSNPLPTPSTQEPHEGHP
jgi:hypothetical protein